MNNMKKILDKRDEVKNRINKLQEEFKTVYRIPLYSKITNYIFSYELL